MPIAASQIQIRLTGGATNANPALSLGGVKSSVEADAALFDKVLDTESATGRTEYRQVNVHNAHASLTLENAIVWIAANTPSDSTVIALGLGVSGLNGVEPAIANETSAPSGVTFVPAASAGTAISLGNIPPGQHRPIWIRRVVAQGAATAAVDSASLRFDGGFTE